MKNPPILIEYPVVVTVTRPEGAETFQRVDELATRRLPGETGVAPLLPEDVRARVFEVDDTRAEIIFGDGLNARIPPPGINNLRVTYRSGGGKRGNGVQLGLALSDSMLQGVKQLDTTAGGLDEQSVKDALKEAPGQIRSLERAVTEKDFELLAQAVAGVQRAIALNRCHPLYPDVETTGAVTLMVIPPRTGIDPAPSPDQQFLHHVAGALEPYRVLTTELFVVPPKYQKVKIAAKLIVERGTDINRVKAAADNELRGYLDPLTGGVDGQGWPLGSGIGYGDLLGRLVGISGVVAVPKLQISVDGHSTLPCEDAPIDTDALIEAEMPELEVEESGGSTS